ncbi:MAG: aminoacetone oxidase family FAD-binding enzyme [Gemmatimonadetes bacterium]|nr:aminoacetone oxidase family FAD-binding enzyme [Gemmatimonadota bacterium]
MKKVIVVGAGAAGTMAAIFAAASGAETVLVEGTRDGGRKILISGGGRCNVLPMVADESRFVTDSSPHSLRKFLRAWPLHEQRAFFEHTIGIPLVEEVASGKIFPASHKARDIRDGLLNHARACGVGMIMQTRMVDAAPRDGRWLVSLDTGASLEADALVLATGGRSVPNTGSDGMGLDLLGRLGHVVHPTYAALTPLLDAHGTFADLAGVSLAVSLVAKSDRFVAASSGGFLFTHQGYSGPSVLDVSHVVSRAHRGHSGPATVHVQWTTLGDAEWEAALRPHGARTVTGALRAELPDRLAAALLHRAAVDPARQLAELRREEKARIIETLVRGVLPCTGDDGYRKAEVTGGGASLGEVHPRTLESRRHPGLYLCGELLDAFGPIGGYNFLWAWATGRTAGTAAASTG